MYTTRAGELYVAMHNVCKLVCILQASNCTAQVIITPRACAQGVKQSVCPSVVVVVVVVVGTKIARSRVLGVCACYKHNQSVDIGEKIVYTRFKFLKTAY